MFLLLILCILTLVIGLSAIHNKYEKVETLLEDQTDSCQKECVIPIYKTI